MYCFNEHKLIALAFFLITCCTGLGQVKLEKDAMRLTASKAGVLSLAYEDTVIVNSEQLQLVDQSKGWQVLFAYGRSGKTSMKPTEAGYEVSETIPGGLNYTKSFGVTDDGVKWRVKWKVPSQANKTRNYYFLDIPADLIKDAVYECRYANGLRKGVLGVGVPDGDSLRSALFVTDRYRIRFDLESWGVVWKLTDWSGSQHKSYRFRIETPAEEGVNAEAAVTIKVEPSTPEARSALMEKWAAEEKRRLDARMTELKLKARSPLKLGAVTANASSVNQGKKLELTFGLNATYDNPFDFDDIDVTCEFRTPSGTSITVPAFYYAPFERNEDGTIAARGDAVWKVRFTPRDVGGYSYRIRARDRSGKVSSPKGTFSCTSNEFRGFVRVSKTNPLMFEFEDGSPYMPIGINLFHSTRLGQGIDPARLKSGEYYMKRLADAEGNFIRLRADSWFYAIEGTADAACGYLGPGWYQQQSCFEIDKIYELAERRGIRVMHCFYNANGMVNLGKPHPDSKYAWRRPYAWFLKENGGPCKKSIDFWTNSEVAALARRKLRYSVARWGYSPNLMCWEYWNELVLKKGVIDEQVSWHRDMSRYLRSIDPWHHPITNSNMSRDFDQQESFWQLAEMEIVQIHSYRGEGLCTYMSDLASDAVRRWRKPFFFGEQGIIHRDHTQGFYPYDPNGLHLHNGLWAPVMAGASGPGAFWFVQGYLDKRDLYYHYTAFKRFAQKVPWNTAALVPLSVKGITFADPDAKPGLTEGTISARSKSPMDKASVNRFVVDARTGQVSDSIHLQSRLHAMSSRKTTPTFVLDCREPATFVVRVDLSVGDMSNALKVTIDGQPVLTEPFPAGKDQGKNSELIPQYANWRSIYGRNVEIPVPAGQHELTLEAVGKDRLEVSYSIRNYFEPHPLVVTGLKNGEGAWFWARNRQSTAYHLRAGGIIEPTPAMRVALSGFQDGNYTVEWWDTWQAKTVKSVSAQCVNGELTIGVPSLKHDLAASCTLVR